MNRFSYSGVGATRAALTSGALPPGYHHLDVRRRIGTGPELFTQTAETILSFGMQKGAKVFGDASSLRAEAGTSVRIRLGTGPLSITAPTRVVFVIDEPRLRGFAYGTLPGHPESGEELFVAEYGPADDTVYARIIAFSRPAAWYSRLAGPAGRLAQRIITERYLRAVIPPGAQTPE